MGKPTRRQILDSIDPARRDRAFQLDMLAIDEEFSGRWLETMRSLVAKELPEPDFTVQRMAALESWTRERKRRQAQLQWKYDRTGKRRPGLVTRDIDKAWADVEKQMDRIVKQQETINARREADREKHTQRLSRIREGLQTAAAALPQRSTAEEREMALALVRKKLGKPDGSMVDHADISAFLNQTRALMSEEQRRVFLQVVHGR